MIRCLKGGLFSGFLGLACVIGSSARADRTLTEYEANKLTFSALIAPPSHFYHPKKIVKKTHTHTTRLAKLHQKTNIRTVAYHGHVISKHRRNTHRRRG